MGIVGICERILQHIGKYVHSLFESEMRRLICLMSVCSVWSQDLAWHKDWKQGETLSPDSVQSGKTHVLTPRWFPSCKTHKLSVEFLCVRIKQTYVTIKQQRANQ